MKKIGLFVVAIVLVLAGFFIYNQMSSPSASQYGTFSGALPCADCEQLKTTVVLNKDPNTSAPTTYTLEQVYVGTKVDPIVKTGRWGIQKGTPQDPNATVIVLNSDQEVSRQLYMQQLNNNELQMLNQDEGKISSPLNFTLTRQK